MWTCSQCNKAFNSARALKIHEVKQHENMPKRYLKCSHCDEVFEHGNLLQIHMKVHHNIKVRCPQCKDIFDHPKALSMHVKAHNTEPVCPVCGVKFDHDKLLKLHMEHYHKVSKKETTSLPSEQLEVQTFQPLANLISPDSKRASESPERRRVNGSSLSPNDIHHREATPSPGREDNLREAFHEVKNEDRNSRHRSQSPQEVNIPNQESLRREMFARSQGYDNMYHHRLLAPMHNRPIFYRPLDDKPRGPPPFGMMPFQPPGLRRRLEKRPLGRSHSFPLKQEASYHDMPPVVPWQMAEANPMRYGPAPREKRIDRAVLEAVRNNLKAKLRTVEATLLGEEADPHHPLSSTLAEYYEQQGPLCSREELSRQYRPSVITPRTTFDNYPFKRKASPNDLEPQEKIRRYEDREVMRDNMDSPGASPSRKPTGIPFISGSEMRTRFHDPIAQSMYARPFNTRDDLSILKRTDDMSFGDQNKIFIKRGAPRCNRCQQTFSSKMEYLHHLISHREKDGFADESPEEMEFIEGARRSMNLKTFAMEGHHRISSNTTPEGSLSPKGEELRESLKAIGGDDDEADKTEKKIKAKKSPGEQPSPLASQSEGDSLSLATATCSECKDVFADSMSCRMHIEKRHMKPRCRECGLTFDHKNLLKIHMDCYHSTLDVLQCYYCGMSFKQRSEFLDHLTSHETQEINKDKLGEQGNESAEPGGRRRWGRLVASAQLPSEKPDLGNKERIPLRTDFLGTRETSLLKSNGKTKLRKAVSLSTYTDMINRNKRSAADFLRDSRAKGDEVIGRETRTRIFLPNFEDRKMEDVSRFHSAHSTDKELASPLMARQRPSQEEIERLFLKRKAFQSRDNDDARAFWSAERPPFTAHSVEEKHDQADSYIGKKDELRRLQRSVPGEENMKNQHMPLFRKAFVRDEVETLYQLRHKKSLHNPEGKDGDSPPPEPSDHRSDLVKIERIELNPIARQHKPVEREQHGLRPNYDSEQRDEVISSKERRHNVPEQEPYSTLVHSRSSPKRYHEEAATSVVPPPPLIDIRRYSQNSSPLNVCSTVSADSSPASSRSNSPLPVTKSHDYKSNKGKVELEASNSPVAESIDCSSSMKELKGKRRNSIKKLTKEALINSLSLKRRASAPDLYQMQRESTEYASPEKAESPKTELTDSPGSPSVGSDDRASPVETKHHGSRSLQYTPRKQSERDVTCTQCGVSFGHKKLYKIHLDSYHGKPQNHECLQCGSKNFRDKDEFLKHLMAHQTEGKTKGDEEEERKTLVEEREGSEDSQRSRSPFDMRDENPEIVPKAKIPRRDTRQEYEKIKNMEDVPHYVGQIVNDTSKNENDLNDEPRVNNNAKDLNDKTTCFTCGKTFDNGKQLEQHFSSHASISEDGRFCCVLCGKAFETHRKLEIHSRSHTGFKPHKCEQCGRCFPYYSSYYYHKMTHTKDRPHKCPLCGKGFIQTRYLRSHLKTHKDEQGALSDEVESIIQKVELNMNDETDEESIDSPGTAENSPAYRANDEEAETAEILCSFKRGLNCSAQNSDTESPPVSNSSVSD